MNGKEASRQPDKHCLCQVRGQAVAPFPQYANIVAFGEEELKTTFRKTIRREVDNVLLYHVSGKPIIVHVEVQSDDSTKFNNRNLLYLSLIREKHPKEEIVQLVIYTGEKPPRHVGRPIKLDKLYYETIS